MRLSAGEQRGLGGGLGWGPDEDISLDFLSRLPSQGSVHLGKNGGPIMFPNGSPYSYPFIRSCTITYSKTCLLGKQH